MSLHLDRTFSYFFPSVSLSSCLFESPSSNLFKGGDPAPPLQNSGPKVVTLFVIPLGILILVLATPWPETGTSVCDVPGLQRHWFLSCCPQKSPTFLYGLQDPLCSVLWPPPSLVLSYFPLPTRLSSHIIFLLHSLRSHPLMFGSLNISEILFLVGM